ncbi:MAG: type II toxin-antitoxin system Phd/YefM family antitoxin [Chloroflexi bacterium]|nr:type II toxin-antitoxin system Phd/YefM family antitoxin [Chloroflexota bacterium]
MAKTISLKDAATAYVAAIEQVKASGEAVIVEQGGKPSVVVISYNDYAELAALRQTERDKKWMEEQHQILMREYDAFERLKPELLKTYKDKFVAIHNGELVDSDDDDKLLLERVDAKFGDITMLVTQVTEIERVYHVNSPKVVRQ